MTRRILDSMLADVKSTHLTHEVLITLMAEVSAGINARPLVHVSNDQDCPEILSSAMLKLRNVSSLFSMIISPLIPKFNGNTFSHCRTHFGNAGIWNTCKYFHVGASGKLMNLTLNREMLFCLRTALSIVTTGL